MNQSFKLEDLGQPILVASHPRSGTHLTMDTLRRQFTACAAWKWPGERLDRLYLPLEGLTVSEKEMSWCIAQRILGRSPRPLLKTHAYPALAHLKADFPKLHQWIQDTAQTIYVVRDGRSVLCSRHLFMQSYNPETRCSISEFLRQEVNGKSRVRAWATHVQTWMAQPDVTVLQFEQVIQQPRQTLADLGEKLSLSPRFVEPLLPRSPHNIWQGRWARLTQWHPESTAIIGYYGGQKTRKWRDILSEGDRYFFHQEAGELLLKLGYISSDAWVTDQS
ncbi:sulfotransferase domain-containing protein [Vacuolonema iberomarrocanum]|uniref:sulfotransferase domain-containing protein n=1 Tax=Vacuolonema iberomarrocanum TaxID=3454632 RepID=UPI0019DA711C|nr:sulfotransferase domain-containing protein [filamentous cyanobacterium LEGE 07170]